MRNRSLWMVIFLAIVNAVVMAGTADETPQRGPGGGTGRAFSEPVRPDLRGFSLTLVQGDMKSGGATDAVPAAAARALADMKDFLPYKSYTLLDTAWTLGSGAIKAQLRQSDTQVFDIELHAGGVPLPGLDGGPAGTVNVTNFRMRRSGPNGGDRERQEVENALRGTEQSLASLRQQHAEAQRASGEGGRQATAALQQRITQVTEELNKFRTVSDSMAARDAIIDTSFRMKVGETVVVGTSRQQGDRALIVIVTAVGR